MKTYFIIFLMFFVFLPWILVQIYGCEHCNTINEHCEEQYYEYNKILRFTQITDRSYIEGKADAYREMTYFLEPYIYSKRP